MCKNYTKSKAQFFLHSFLYLIKMPNIVIKFQSEFCKLRKSLKRKNKVTAKKSCRRNSHGANKDSRLRTCAKPSPIRTRRKPGQSAFVNILFW